MNTLPRNKQIEAIAALCEGVSVRATERLTGVNRGTILSLGVRIGDGCAVLHDAMMRGLHVGRIELDEAWSFVAKKQRRLKPTDPADFGDQYVFLALAGAGKAIISWRVGKRNGENCRAFLADLRGQLSTGQERRNAPATVAAPKTRREIRSVIGRRHRLVCPCSTRAARLRAQPARPASRTTLLSAGSSPSQYCAQASASCRRFSNRSPRR
jgi:hypothetical protein